MRTLQISQQKELNLAYKPTIIFFNWWMGWEHFKYHNKKS